MAEQEAARKKPEWLKIRLNTSDNYHFLKKLMRAESLHTVCEEARCPNLQECWGTLGTASFMILGDTCTRRCRFCAVGTGLPGEVDQLEPLRVAGAVEHMGLKHVHVTMVNRDDLPDGGASLMAATVRAVRWRNPSCSIEVLTSDFMGSEEAIRAVVESRPDIISHNVETVRRLTPRVRSRSSYDRSLEFLRIARALDPETVVKSSIMVGLGETFEEVAETMDDLRARGVDVVNIGQYLQPTRNHIPVRRYWTPEEFRRLKDLALEKGFLYCEAGPFVRSSYHADAQYQGFQQHLEQLRAARAGKAGSS
ncbi:MAG TPA: lipoyl synthase [Spirochaetia bacterium]|nr:lipoyl synthase [Spirochaetia bacterium]